MVLWLPVSATLARKHLNTAAWNFPDLGPFSHATLYMGEWESMASIISWGWISETSIISRAFIQLYHQVKVLRYILPYNVLMEEHLFQKGLSLKVSVLGCCTEITINWVFVQNWQLKEYPARTQSLVKTWMNWSRDNRWVKERFSAKMHMSSWNHKIEMSSKYNLKFRDRSE